MILVIGQRKRIRPNWGFTLIEILIVIALIGVLISISVPTLQSLGTSKLRADMVHVQGILREAFVLASLSGQNHRVVFDLNNQQYWVEVGAEQALVQQRQQKAKEKPKGGILGFLNGPEDVQRQEKDELSLVYDEFKPVSGRLGEKRKLSKGVEFFAVWTEHLKEKAKEGEVPIYFFSDGYAEKAYVTLGESNQSGQIRVLVLEPLTGETHMELDEPNSAEKKK